VLESRLADLVGPEHVLTDRDVLAGYETDWTGRRHGHARLAVRPATRDEVAAVLRTCRDAGVAVVAQGGNTGLVGGGVPRGGEVVLSLARLTGLGPVDRLAGQVTVGAGATLAAVQRHARSVGLDFAVDLAARDSATIGGMVATNAGGLRVLRWGSMRAQVAGLEAVLADGRVLHRMTGLPKDSTGYDLVGALVGSEGTLAVLTAVRLRLVAAGRHGVTAVLGVADTAAAQRVLAAVRAAVPSLTSAEVFYADGLRIVRQHRGLAAPFGTEAPCYLLLDCAAPDDPTEALATVLDGCADVLDSAIATDEAARRALWAYREGHTDAISALGIPLKLDVGVPAPAVPAFEAELRDLVATAAPGARLILFGHLAEGNFHANLIGAEEADLTDPVLRIVAGHGGTISAEHGVGTAKTRWLPLVRSAVELDLMAATKRAWDPDGLLNPGVLVAAAAEPGRDGGQQTGSDREPERDVQAVGERLGHEVGEERPAGEERGPLRG
jgi:FAD/FMN-containing dehydrogenase